jgi:hypothetical protein
MSVNTVNFFGYGVRVNVTNEAIRANYELDDFEAWLKENHPLLTTVMSGDAYDEARPMTRWVFLESTLVRMWDWEANININQSQDLVDFIEESQPLMRFVLQSQLAYGRIGYVMLRQVG